MFESEREVHIPTDEEEEEIQRQIAQDPDAPEWTDEDWERARPAMEVDAEIVKWSRQTRGRQKAPIKELISIRLDADLASHFRASGKGWQTRLNDTLRKAVFGS
ncbi:MAG: BrnA antitoxin family protein [Chloroflexota bacterium]|nr:BrnA antitoxin family protein [Chloroflexota bacterium]